MQRWVAMCVLCNMEKKMEENVRDPDTGSEAGGEDSLVGNVSKLQVTPPGYTSLPRKGHLIFDACFESGESQTVWKELFTGPCRKQGHSVLTTDFAHSQKSNIDA
ncbi:UNVERIFIED_CONTAM: hypothetical protein FKN15_069598 [Acipenser sinensis]